MKLLACAAVLGLAAPAFTWSTSYTLKYDDVYDQKQRSLSTVACSNGEHGLLTRGFKTFGDLPTFPFIGGASGIQGSDSRLCGGCWELTYTEDSAYSFTESLNFTAIDSCKDGSDDFTISLEGMEHLTRGQAKELNVITITATRKKESACGL